MIARVIDMVAGREMLDVLFSCGHLAESVSTDYGEHARDDDERDAADAESGVQRRRRAGTPLHHARHAPPVERQRSGGLLAAAARECAGNHAAQLALNGQNGFEVEAPATDIVHAADLEKQTLRESPPYRS